jgi:hypothetical protein
MILNAAGDDVQMNIVSKTQLNQAMNSLGRPLTYQEAQSLWACYDTPSLVLQKERPILVLPEDIESEDEIWTDITEESDDDFVDDDTFLDDDGTVCTGTWKEWSDVTVTKVPVMGTIRDVQNGINVSYWGVTGWTTTYTSSVGLIDPCGNVHVLDTTVASTAVLPTLSGTKRLDEYISDIIDELDITTIIPFPEIDFNTVDGGWDDVIEWLEDLPLTPPLPDRKEDPQTLYSEGSYLFNTDASGNIGYSSLGMTGYQALSSLVDAVKLYYPGFDMILTPDWSTVTPNGRGSHQGRFIIKLLPTEGDGGNVTLRN